MTRSSLGTLLAPLVLLAATAGAQDVAAQSDGRYMVKFRDFRGAAQAVSAAGGQVVHELEPQGVVAAYLPEQALKGLQNNPNVEYVEVDPRRYLMGQTVPYGIGMVQATGSAATFPSQGNVTVCIIDSGYHEAHEDLPKIADGRVSGTNVTGTGNWSQDSCGHGTHVAGTVAALDNSTGVVGVSSNGTLGLHIVKVFDGADCAWTYSSSLVSALNVCRTSVPSSQKLVVSMSLGGSIASTTENTAFQQAYDAGVLSVAAAGNDGSTRKSYPASYASVISVAAVDSAEVVASFSQKNSEVEIAAPGVGVVSTTPFKPSSLTVGGNTYLGTNIDGSARIDVPGTLVSGGLCDTTNTAAWSGKLVLCQRGTNSFADKVSKVQGSGGLGAAIYNNVDGGFSGTLNGTSAIPAISLSKADGEAALSSLGAAKIANTAGVGNGYESYDGTSMATPHVSGVAALVWSNHPTKTNAQVRDALQKTAKDKGTTGRDTSYGFGIVQAKDAATYLANGGGTPPPAGITLTVTKVKSGGQNFARLTWAGATSSPDVDYYRTTTRYSTANDGQHDDGPVSRGTYTYKVCNAGTTTCSNSVTVKF
jgi:subtilisin family serine protease